MFKKSVRIVRIGPKKKDEPIAKNKLEGKVSHIGGLKRNIPK